MQYVNILILTKKGKNMTGRVCPFLEIPDHLIWRSQAPAEYGIPYRSLINYERKAHSYPARALFIPKLRKHHKGKFVLYERKQLQEIRFIRGLLGYKEYKIT